MQQKYWAEAKTMVAVVRVSKEGVLLDIREVSDAYREKPYSWDAE